MKNLILLFFVIFSYSKVLVVDDDYSYFHSPCEHGTKKNMWSYYDYRTIKEALRDASDGDIIKICPGTYKENGLDITQSNLTIKSTTTNRNDVKIDTTSLSQKAIFRIKQYINNFLIQNISFNQTSHYSVFYSNTYIKNITLDNLFITSNGRGFYENNSIENFKIQNSKIVSKKESVYLKGINNNITFINIDFQTTDNYSTIRLRNWGNVNISTQNNSRNYLNSKKYGIDISQGIVVIKNTNIKSDNYSIYLRDNIGLVTIDSNKIETKTRGIYSKGELDDKAYILNNKIVVNSNKEGVLIKKALGNLYLNDNNITGGSYGVHIVQASNGGEIKNNILKNASKYGLKLLDSNLWRSFRVINNCFENGIGKNIVSKDRDGYFDKNYYDDWGGSGNYKIPTIPKYDYHPLSSCWGETNESLDVNIFLDYRMDECEWRGVNEEVKDSSGNNHHGTSKNSNTENNETTNGMIGRVGNFIDGNSSVLIEATLPSEYTLSMWIKFPLDETNHIDFNGKKYFNIADVPSSNSDYIYFRHYNNSWDLCMFGNTYECKNYNPQNLNGWHFITFKVSNTDTKFYVDNNLKLTFNQHPNGVQLGLLFNSDYKTNDNIPNGQSIGAYVDEFKIFSGLVKDEDLETIYNNELSRKNYDGNGREDVVCKTYQICYQTSFSNQLEIDENWSIIKNENYIPKVVNNRLRLTKNSNNIATGLTLNNKLFKANGTKFKIRFKHYAYNGSSSKGADGIAVVFSDANITPTAGAFGGSLGYAQRTSPSVENGFSGGWIGIGIDEYGNYSNDNEGRVGGIGFTPQAVAVRGSYLENYKYLTGTNTLTPPISDGDSSSPSPEYIYEIDVDTTQNNKTIISVYRDTGSGDEILINSYEYTSSNTPDYFRLSFTGSTGGENNIHEIDDLQILAFDCNSTFVSPPTYKNYKFDVKELNRNDKNITTKIVNKSFNLEIISDQNFTGTICSAVVDNNENNISNWFKNYFQNNTSSSQTIQGNPNYKVIKANKVNKIKIVWLENSDESCPLSIETNHTLSSDDFSIRPKSFDITDYPNKIFAGGDFDITFKALDENNNETKNYNEELNTTFIIDYKDIKNNCYTGNFKSNVVFNDGKDDVISNYDEIGELNITIQEKNSSSFSSVDNDDTPDIDRLITPKTITIQSCVYKISTQTEFSSNSIIYDDINFSNYGEINISIQLQNKQNDVLKNFNSSCYGKDVNISFDVTKNSIEVFRGMYDINGIEFNDSKFENFDRNFTILKDNFVKGESNLTIKFLRYKNRSYPASISDLNFTKIRSYLNQDTTNIENVNKNYSCYYLGLDNLDITTLEKDITKKIAVIVYDKFGGHFDIQRFLYWYVDDTYNKNSVEILGNTESYKYDNNLTNGFSSSIILQSNEFNLSIHNPNGDKFVIIHLKTPRYLWYSKYSDYNDSLNSYCLSHYCVEYHYTNKTPVYKEVGSGKFKGSEVNMTTPKRRLGIKIYR